jgi:hypothetical protein
VVAFRTYLRTLLHEFGHHVGLPVLSSSPIPPHAGLHQRESSLFHQLVPDARRRMPTREASEDVDPRIG